MIFSKRNRSKIEDPSLLTLLFVAYFNCLTMIVYKLLNRHIPYIFHLCCFVFALIDRVNPLTLTSRFWLIRFIKIICFSLWCVPSLHCFLIPVFILQLIWLILIVPLYYCITTLICIIKSTTIRSQSNEFSFGSNRNGSDRKELIFFVLEFRKKRTTLRRVLWNREDRFRRTHGWERVSNAAARTGQS